MIYRICLLFTVFTLSFVSQTKAQNYSEYEVKLVYIYQFAKYFNWPDANNNKETFTVGIYGNNTLGNLPDKMYQGRKFNGKDCRIINIKSAEEAKACDLVFIIGIKKFEAMQFIKALGKTPVLTIGDELEDFCKIGGMVNFTNKSEALRLELNPENVENASLQVSSRLSSIAKIVGSGEDVF